MGQKTKEPTLLWNERGAIGCTLPGHAPAKGTDTWRFEHWTRIPAGTVSEDGKPFRCETCSAGERTPSEPASQPEPAPEPELVPDAPKKKKPKTDATLSDLAEKYLAHMDRAGKSNGTCFSYKLELQTAMNELGADTKLADLTPEMVAKYFGSARVNKKKSGKAKSPLSIAKTQRVLRLALMWAQEKGWIEKAPLPEQTATH